MAKCKILVRPTGYYNGAEWPEVGKTIDLPDHVAEGLAATGIVEIVKASAAKADTSKVEKRPAAQDDVETRTKAPAKK